MRFTSNLSFGKRILPALAVMAIAGPMALAWVCAYGQAADAPSFEVASIKPASSSASLIGCSGGPGTTDPGMWRCSNVPLAFLISNAYGLQPYQFTTANSCCQARFDITVFGDN